MIRIGDAFLHGRAGRRSATLGTVENSNWGPDHARLLFFAVLSLLLLLPSLAGCSREKSTTPPPGRPAFEVGLLTSGSINDAGWNALGHEGLRRIRDELGAEITHMETNAAAEQTARLGELGSRGFDLVFGHGFEFQETALALAPRFPETAFVISSGSRVTANVFPLVFDLEQPAYLLGMLAAMESKTGKAGLIGGAQLPPIASTFLAFRKGARSVDPDFEVREIYTDGADARIAALALADEECDFLLHQVSAGGRGVVEACRERDLRCFGTSRSQNDLAPEVMVASAVVDVPEAFQAVGRLAKSGKLSPRVFSFGMKDGIVSLAWNEQHRLALPAETMRRLDQTEQEMREGRFVMPAGGG